ncbi:hypothetical protein OAO01_00285 [Oligoflexia bacterium]|nr:hypothetical protein [Oligoflexia bacterium]
MIENCFELQVNCYAGYRGEETPREFTVWGRALKVEAVLDQWLAPEHRYFKVRASDSAEYILRHDNQKQIWELTSFSK